MITLLFIEGSVGSSDLKLPLYFERLLMVMVILVELSVVGCGIIPRIKNRGKILHGGQDILSKSSGVRGALFKSQFN